MSLFGDRDFKEVIRLNEVIRVGEEGKLEVEEITPLGKDSQ